MRGLKGKIAIVTGGLGDLGYASAKRLVEEGCRTAIVDLKPDDAGQAAAIGAVHFQLDLANESQVATQCAAIGERLGPVNVLVNSAACFIFKGVDATPEQWRQICDVNIMGTSLITKYTVPMMKQAGGGSIINFSSVSGFIGQPGGFATYNATKFAIRGLTRCWAMDLAPLNIRVNTLCPGYFYTKAFVESCRKLGKNVDEENRRASELHLLKRQGRPEEIAAAVAFLASDESSFMTGSDMIVDGGYLAQ